MQAGKEQVTSSMQGYAKVNGGEVVVKQARRSHGVNMTIGPIEEGGTKAAVGQEVGCKSRKKSDEVGHRK